MTPMEDNNRCEQVIERYATAIRDGSRARAVGDACLILTPFSRPDGGAVELEVQTLGGGQLQISDLGESIGYLYVNGLTVNTDTLAEIRRHIRQYGVDLTDYELTARAKSPADAGERFQAVIQAALRVTDMIQKRRPYQQLRFEDVVESYLVGNRAVYDKDFQVAGETLTHKVKFHVDSGRRILLQPLSATNEQVAFSWAERWAYRFDDIRRRDPAWNPYAVLDDRDKKSEVWTSRTIRVLERDATVVHWVDPQLLTRALTEQGA
jgi:hypothetical protein